MAFQSRAPRNINLNVGKTLGGVHWSVLIVLIGEKLLGSVESHN